MLTKMVDGKEVVCSEEEERLIRMKWELNDRYPDYCGHIVFDGISEPKHDLVECKKKHAFLVNAEIQKKLDSLKLLIEQSEEDGASSLVELLSRRKLLKGHANPDLSSVSVIDQLKAHFEKVVAL